MRNRPQRHRARPVGLRLTAPDMIKTGSSTDAPESGTASRSCRPTGSNNPPHHRPSTPTTARSGGSSVSRMDPATSPSAAAAAHHRAAEIASGDRLPVRGAGGQRDRHQRPGTAPQGGCRRPSVMTAVGAASAATRADWWRFLVGVVEDAVTHPLRARFQQFGSGLECHDQ